MRRPVILTIEAWLILLFSALKLLVALRYFSVSPALHTHSSQMIKDYLLVDFVSSVFFLISAVGLLRGSNNARLLFIVVQVLYWGYFLIGGMSSVVFVQLLVSIIFIGVLFLPENNRYFLAKSKKDSEESQ